MTHPRRPSTKTLFTLFLVLEGILYVSFLAIDLFFPHKHALSSQLKYLCILAILIAILAFRGSPWLRLAFAITAIADVFLLFTEYYTVGIAVFCFAHCAHACRFAGPLRKKFLLRYGILAVLVFLVFGIARGSGAIIPTLLPFALLYTVGILGATYILGTHSVRASALTQSQKKVAMAGMLLFLACDVCVLFYNLGAYINSIPFSLTALVSQFMWFFYLPSQLCLLRSGIKLTE